MNFRQITPFMILMFFIAMMMQVGCDTLITEVNNNRFFDTTLGKACVDACHTDDKNLLARPRGQFDNSAHANHSLLDVIDESCNSCHTHEGFLKDVEGSITSTVAYSAMSCFTCHLPHTGEYGDWDIKAIRLSDRAVQFSNGLSANFGLSNSCTHCHSSNYELPSSDMVLLDEAFGPHISSQTDIASGKNGYFMVLDTSNFNSGQHFTNGCIKCHYGTYGEGQGYTYAEHTFRLKDKNTSQEYYETCNVVGCHVGIKEIIDFYDHDSVRVIDSLATEAITLLESFDILQTGDTTGLLFNVDDSIPQIQAQAYFNFLLYKNDGSRGIHNLKFVTELMDTTVDILDSLPAIPSFTLDNPIGCSGHTVTFTPSIVGDFNSLFWDFDNGQTTVTSADSSISVTYDLPGTYTVTLVTASMWEFDSLDVNGIDTILINRIAIDSFAIVDSIKIDTVPVASFVADADTVCLNTDITFTSTSDFLLPATMVWDFGDGSSSILPVATHAYSTSGTYTVSLIVTTDCGVDTTEMVDLISIFVGPTASFTFAQDAVDTLKYQFTDASTSAPAVDWSWEFFEDATSVGKSVLQNPTYTFSANVQFTATAVLTVRSSNGCSSTTTRTIF